MGGAIFGSNLHIKNSVFLNNESKTGGALDGETSLYGGVLVYGNKNTTLNKYSSYTAYGRGGNTLFIEGEANESIFMFDPFQKGDPDGILQIRKNKDSKSNFFLGGESILDIGRVEIQDGTLTLTSVEYERGKGYTLAKLDLNKNDTRSFFYPRKGAILMGSGEISAWEIFLSGTITPSTWVNTGMRSDEITSSITDAEIAAIGTRQDSIYGKIVFDNNVIFGNDARYDVDIAWNADGTRKDSDLLQVNGSLGFNGSNNKIHIKGISLESDILSDTELEKFEEIKIIDARDGIHSGGKTNSGKDYDGGVSLNYDKGQVPDYLRYIMAKSSDGKSYSIGLKLNWGNFTSGSFTLDDGKIFTINNDLRDNYGNNLNKNGRGSLILNGANAYTALTKINDGTLVLGENINRSSARILGNVAVGDSATFSGFGSVKNNGNTQVK